jgi:hypothetical protein
MKYKKLIAKNVTRYFFKSLHNTKLTLNLSQIYWSSRRRSFIIILDFELTTMTTVLLEKPIVTQHGKIFYDLYGNYHPINKIYFNTIYLCLCLPLSFLLKCCIYLIFISRMSYTSQIQSHWCDQLHNFLQPPISLSLLVPNTLHTLISNTLYSKLKTDLLLTFSWKRCILSVKEFYRN